MFLVSYLAFIGTWMFTWYYVMITLNTIMAGCLHEELMWWKLASKSSTYDQDFCFSYTEDQLCKTFCKFYAVDSSQTWAPGMATVSGIAIVKLTDHLVEGFETFVFLHPNTFYVFVINVTKDYIYFLIVYYLETKRLGTRIEPVGEPYREVCQSPWKENWRMP